MLLDRYPDPISVEQLLDDPNAPSWIVVASQDPIGLVANKLVVAGQGSCALVECEEGFVVGIFTEQDYLRALNMDSSDCDDDDQSLLTEADTEAKAVQIFSMPVAQFATQVEQLRTVEPSCSVVRALRIMGSRGFRHLPVVRPGSRPEALPSSAVLGVLSITSLTNWLQRDSEALQAKHLEALFDINPRWRLEGEGETCVPPASTSNEQRLPLMLSFGAGDEMITALSADLLVIMAYRSAWVMADNWLGEEALVNLGIFAAAVPAIWWLRGKPGYADDEDADVDGSAAFEEQRQAEATGEAAPETGKSRAGKRRRMKSILNDV
jgi:CBS domain-containing protein